ncbi:ATP-dependent DNA ligase [Streptomyces sp. KR80]|uniref:ATP-dependent DNA ligase n=1 Tax=Streptomyces sp. KR80 TaxID=3457426 RepID=UPI003FD3EA9F
MGDEEVVMWPPLEVMRPKRAAAIPPEDGMPGGVQYTVKLDGFRALAFSLPRRVTLQSRSGRDLARDFPTIASAVATLPHGTVLDGEICAWVEGRFAFEQLLRSRAARDADQVALAYIAFDLLALPGRDVRGLPLSQRWDLLEGALTHAAPLIQRVLATEDRAVALDWYEGLTAAGVEGLVCRSLASHYRPGDARAWVKVRHSDTTDASVVAVIGPPTRPQAVVVELADGRRKVTVPRLDAVQARQVAAATADRLGSARTDPDLGPVHPVTERLLAEVEVRTGRDPVVRFVRLRGEL